MVRQHQISMRNWRIGNLEIPGSMLRIARNDAKSQTHWLVTGGMKQ